VAFFEYGILIAGAGMQLNLSVRQGQQFITNSLYAHYNNSYILTFPEWLSAGCLRKNNSHEKSIRNNPCNRSFICGMQPGPDGP